MRIEKKKIIMEKILFNFLRIKIINLIQGYFFKIRDELILISKKERKISK